MNFNIADISKIILLYLSTGFLANGIVTDDINMERIFSYITLGLALLLTTPPIIKQSVKSDNFWEFSGLICVNLIPVFVAAYSIAYNNHIARPVYHAVSWTVIYVVAVEIICFTLRRKS